MNPDGINELRIAIIIQTVKDYKVACKDKDIEEIEKFIRSKWFGLLISEDIDPELFIEKLKELDSRSEYLSRYKVNYDKAQTEKTIKLLENSKSSYREISEKTGLRVNSVRRLNYIHDIRPRRGQKEG